MLNKTGITGLFVFLMLLSFQFIKRSDRLLPKRNLFGIFVPCIQSHRIRNRKGKNNGLSRRLHTGIFHNSRHDGIALVFFRYDEGQVFFGSQRHPEEKFRLVHAGTPRMYYRAAVSAGAPGRIHDKIVMSLVTDYHQ